MQPPPSAAIAITVLADFPFTFAKDFHPGAIDHQVHRLGSAPTRQLNLQGHTSSRERRIIRHRQVQVEQFKDRAKKTFGPPQRQVIDFLQGGHRQDRRLGIVFWMAALAAAGLIIPGRNHVFTEQDGQTSTVDQRFVIIFPITETLLLVSFSSQIKNTSKAVSITICATTPTTIERSIYAHR